MAWTTPLTAVANAMFTAEDWNLYVRDNLNVTAPGIASTAGRILVTGGANQVVERAIPDDIVEGGQSTTSTSYTDLTTVGPTVTLTTGTQAFVAISAQLNNDTADATSYVAFNVTGATTSGASDANAIQLTVDSANQDVRTSVYNLIALTPGENTFTMVYRVSSGTGVFRRRRIQVMGL